MVCFKITKLNLASLVFMKQSLQHCPIYFLLVAFTFVFVVVHIVIVVSIFCFYIFMIVEKKFTTLALEF